jgi:Xaa-Pro aminopeptidase
VLRTDGGPAYTLFVQPRDPAAETWTGRRPGVDGAREIHGADEAHDVALFPERLPDIVRGVRRIYHCLGRRREIDQRLVEIQADARRQSRTSPAPVDEVVDPRGLLHEMRLFKEEPEIALMRRAAEISAVAHRAAARLARPGRFEYELEGQLFNHFRGSGGSGPAYGSIVAGGRNATILHYVSNQEVLRKGELVLVDAGVELEGYASDVTRTYPIGARFEGPGREVYEAVLDAQLAALDACTPGTTLPAIHEITVRRLCEHMLSLGLLEGVSTDLDELIESEAYRRYYMHGTSHWLGLDVHDVGLYRKDDQPRPLEPGMCFTVEPGLYVPEDDETAPAHLRGIGVRIEDDVIVTADGHENLNTAIPKTPDDVEHWMA